MTHDTKHDFFELARTSNEVNADLNSQKLPVLPGTYNYVRMDLCIGSAKSQNIKFQADGMTETSNVKNGTCGFTSAKATAPIVIGEGESVTISLTYDLTSKVYDYGDGMTKSDNCYFNDSSTIRRCVDMPTMTPTVTKN